MSDELTEKNAMMQFCQDLFSTSNLIAGDFDDVQVFKVMKRDFPQQPDGVGLHISFSVSWQAVGKTGKQAHDALDVLFPDDDTSDD